MFYRIIIKKVYERKKNYEKIVAILLSLMLLLPMCAFADDMNLSEVMDAREFLSSNGIALPYRIYVPKNYDETKKYSFLLFLHGAGNRGDDNGQLIENGGLIKRIIGGEIITCGDTKINAADEFIVVAPQCQIDFQWVDTPWDKSPDLSYNLNEVAKSPYMTALDELLEAFEGEYSLNKDRLYITGLSMGGFGVWDSLMRHPDKWAAAIPMAGTADIAVTDTIRHIPIWTFHQYFDALVLPEGTHRITEALVNAGAEIKFTGYFDRQHNAWDKGYAEPEMLNWLYSHTKRSAESFVPSYRIEKISDWANRQTSNDVAEPSEKTIEAISWLEAKGIVKGYPDGGVHPLAELSREETVALIYRTYMTMNTPE